MAVTRDRGRRFQWADLCEDEAYVGRWVALDNVRYDSGAPVEGDILDADENLATLCVRIQGADHKAATIFFCDDGGSGIRRAPVQS